MNLESLSAPQRVMGASMVAVLLGAFLPWVSIFGISVSGIHGDGVITLILSLAGLALLAFTSGVVGEARTGKAPTFVLLGLAALTTLIALIDMNGAAAIGLYLTLLGGIAWIVGAAWQASLDSKSATQPSDAPRQ